MTIVRMAKKAKTASEREKRQKDCLGCEDCKGACLLYFSLLDADVANGSAS